MGLRWGRHKVGLRKERVWWELLVEFCAIHVCGTSETPSRDIQQETDNADPKLRRKV